MQSRPWSLPAVAAGVAIAIGAMLAASTADAQNAKKAGPAGGSSSNINSSSGSLVTGDSLDAMMSSLEKAGFSVQMDTDSDGDPQIESTDDDAPFVVRFYGCNDGKGCEYIQFEEGWDLPNGTTSDVVESWNENYVWGRAYLDSDNDPWVDMAVNLKGGVSQADFDDVVSWWWAVIHDFEDHIGFDN